MRRHLYLQIYVGFVLVAVVAVVAAGAMARLLYADEEARFVAPSRAMLQYVAADVDRDVGEGARLQSALEDRAAKLGFDLSMWSATGEPLAETGAPLPGPRAGGEGHLMSEGRPGVRVRLGDGRWMAAASASWSRQGRRGSGLMFVVLALVVALACWPVARRITRRLEALERGVAEWGAGDLSARVPVLGRDEVARLAQRFNGSAARIEELVNGQRRMLASASHELRSPLARLRMALELLADRSGEAGLGEEAARDVEELDGLIGDLLLASQLQSGRLPRSREAVDLGALAAEEAQRLGASGQAEAVWVAGDPRMLRRLVRNLLENAKRHGGSSAAEIEARVERSGAGAVLVVADRGPGVPPSERDRIFEPFYRADDHRESDDGGVGLGLALVRDIARHHGGEVSYRPRDGGGSAFEVVLPAADAPDAAPEEA